MAIILSIETSTSVCSVALHQNDKLLATLEVHQEYSHASRLGVLVDQVGKLADVSMSEVNAVAVSSGPGSYTGLRIGTSLAKGLCYALSVPLIAVPTLQLMAAAIGRVNTNEVFFCPMIDARRMEVYCQVYDHNLCEVEPIQAKVIDDKSFQVYLNVRPVMFFGNGATKCKPVITHENAKFLPDVNPLASQLGELAYLRLQQGKTEDLIGFVPLYLKEFLIKKPVEV
jgi:tRNA threonylcarbamoyladenosine biosynthesis protein TsaB